MRLVHVSTGASECKFLQIKWNTFPLTRSVQIEVVIIDRVKSWKGVSFPGGHVEEGEGIVEAAILEVDRDINIIPVLMKESLKSE